MDMNENISPEKENSMSSDLERLLEERARLDDIIQKKFTKTVTIMFTDMKGSSSIAEAEGDMVSRFIIKKHNDILFPVIKDFQGVLVKTMGDGTLSYFDSARDAVSAAIKIQMDINEFNHTRPGKTAIQVRIGLNTGTSIVEKDDIFGDVVNVASRFQTLAMPGEIYISENTYNALDNREEFYCRFVRETQLKSMRGIFRVFKVFWDRQEIEHDKALREAAIIGVDEAVKTISIGELSGEGKQVETKENPAIVIKANDLEKENELLELYLYCEEFRTGTTVKIYEKLRKDLESSQKMATKFNGQDAFWFFRNAITIGRIPEADFPVTNKILSRAPLLVGIKNKDGFLSIDTRDAARIRDVEVEKSFKKEKVTPGEEYNMGKSGVIVLSVCFPIEFKVYKDRFLVLKILDPRECVKKQFNIELHDVWKDFAKESERLLIIGR